MNRPIVWTSLLCVAAAFAVARGQTRPTTGTRPTDAERLAQIAEELGGTPEQVAMAAKDFGATPEQFLELARKEMGELLLADGPVWVGVRRDDAGRIASVKIRSPKGIVALDAKAARRPGADVLTGDPTKGSFAAATDLDGDGRADQIVFRRKLDASTLTNLLRVGDHFEPATPAPDRRFRLNADGRIVGFDVATHEWSETPATRP